METVSPQLSPADQLKSLYALHVALGAHDGYESRLVSSKPKQPMLVVRNSNHKKLSEAITVTEEAGERFYVWSWGTRMLPTSEVAEAVRRIKHVLSPPAANNA